MESIPDGSSGHRICAQYTKPSTYVFHLTANLKNWFISYKSCIPNSVGTGKSSGWWPQQCWSWLLCWGSTVPITLVWSRPTGPLGNPLARQPKGTHGGAQDSSMSSLQSSKKPDTRPVPCSSTQPAALSPSMMCQAWARAHHCCRQGNKQGFFHTRHPYGSYSHTVTDVLGGSICPLERIGVTFKYC